MDTRSVNTAKIAPPPAISLKGFGELLDLHVAMGKDSALNTLVRNFVKNWTLERFVQSSVDLDVQNILFKWAGVQNVVPNSRGNLVDARVAGFVEKLTGQPFTNAQLANTTSANYVKQAYGEVFGIFKAQLMLQAGASSIFATKPVYNLATGEIEGGVVTLKSLSGVIEQAKTLGAVYWANVALFLLRVKSAGAYSDAEVTAINMAIQKTNSAIYWDWYDQVDGLVPSPSMVSGASIESFQGSQFADHLVGNNASNILQGGDGDDILVGRLGDDRLEGGNGNDVYVYRAGDDKDTIVEAGGTDTLAIEGAFAKADVTFGRDLLDPNALNIYLKTKLIATVTDHFLGGNTLLESVTLDNGTAISLAGFKNVNGTTGDDMLNGLDNPRLAMSDAIYGGDGKDTLNGKKGNDFLSAAKGTTRIHTQPAMVPISLWKPVAPPTPSNLCRLPRPPPHRPSCSHRPMSRSCARAMTC